MSWRHDVAVIASETEPYSHSLSRRGRGALSPRELHCLELAAEGLSYVSIAGLLYVEKCTVNTHLDNARYKLGARNTTHACVKAMRLGLIQ